MNCLVCREETETSQVSYCRAHKRALENIKQAFTAWTTAYDSLTVPDFLDRLQKLPGSGRKVREIARFLLENPSGWN